VRRRDHRLGDGGGSVSVENWCGLALFTVVSIVMIVWALRGKAGR